MNTEIELKMKEYERLLEKSKEPSLSEEGRRRLANQAFEIMVQIVEIERPEDDED